VRIVCRPELASGFALAGLATEEVSDAAAGVARVEALLREPGVGVVLVEEDLFAALPDEIPRGAGASSPRCARGWK
jgi:vacuolar-type H+-ATPase subunit F/Vma7